MSTGINRKCGAHKESLFLIDDFITTATLSLLDFEGKNSKEYL